MDDYYCCCDDYNIICKQKILYTKLEDYFQIVSVKIADYIIQILA